MSADCVKKKSEMIERWIWRKIDVFGIIFGFTIAISTPVEIEPLSQPTGTSSVIEAGSPVL